MIIVPVEEPSPDLSKPTENEIISTEEAVASPTDEAVPVAEVAPLKEEDVSTPTVEVTNPTPDPDKLRENDIAVGEAVMNVHRVEEEIKEYEEEKDLASSAEVVADLNETLELSKLELEQAEAELELAVAIAEAEKDGIVEEEEQTAIDIAQQEVIIADAKWDVAFEQQWNEDVKEYVEEKDTNFTETDVKVSDAGDGTFDEARSRYRDATNVETER